MFRLPSTICYRVASDVATYGQSLYVIQGITKVRHVPPEKYLATPTKPSSNGDTAPRNSSSSSPNES